LFCCYEGVFTFMKTNDKNYDEILLAMINENTVDKIIEFLTDYLSLLGAS
jgi:hypothetical protein